MSKISRAVKIELHRETDGHCWYCGSELVVYTRSSTNRFSVDHIIPQRKGGTDHINNLLACCLSCNTEKKDRTLEEYRAYLTRKNNGVPLFSKEQISYLESISVKLPVVEPHQFWGEQYDEPQGKKFDLLMFLIENLDEYGNSCQEWWDKAAADEDRQYAQWLNAQYVTGDEL